ncbi:GNAT family N-acetyltransferase [Pseudoduganella sp. FT26W]|uniref:GNAT family N-acetyltransferase n=1 Tax=Duganella aquatilis TaxID=2666082 RepID=A0A844D712_9BURK|nr:GNAT family N-acetyltransferase [Duganella aquatilis]MRW83009.1 GNAT family N-acetyltransferase [Duganella aquatilis]
MTTISLPDEIRTQRLTLRAPRRSDAPALFAAYTQDIDVARYMTWRPHTQLAQTQGFIDYCIKAWDDGSCRPYLLVPHDNDDIPIGMLEARLQPRTIDLGYVLQRKYWGEGLMPEAIVSFNQLALALPEYFRIQATCDVDNVASARTLEKSGFLREGRLERHTVIPNLSAEPRPSFMYARCR